MRKIAGMLWLVVAVLGSVTGAAAETPTERRLRLLEEQIKRAQDEIQRLKGEIQQQKAIGQATQKQAEQAGEEAKVATAEAKKSVLAGWKDGFYLESPDGSYKLRFKGYLQAQGRFPFGKSTDATNSSFFLRRLRLIFEGTVAKWFDYKFMPAFDGGTPTIEDAYMDVTYFGPDVKLRGGKMKVPLSLERLESASDLLLIQRSVVNQLSPNRDIGFYLFGDLFNSRVTYQLGAFDGTLDNGSNSSGDINDGKEMAARVFASPFRTWDEPYLKGLGIGAAATYGNDNQGESLSSLSYKTAESVTWFKYLTSSSITATQSGNRARVDPQGYYFWGPFSMMGEWIWTQEGVTQVNAGTTRQATFNDTGYMAQATYVLTGEDAAYKGLTPRNNFDPRNGHWGAFEVALRGSKLNVDDLAFADGFADPTVSAGSATEITAGVNWYLSRNFKFQLNYVHTAFDHQILINSSPFSAVQSFLMQMQLSY